MTLSELAGQTGLARPTVRRILITLEELGYVRAADRGYALTPRVLDLGMAYVNALNMWQVARPHMERLVAQTNESTSMAQLDGSDIVYVARVAVPKIVTLAVTIGTRFPAPATSMGKVLLAALPPAEPCPPPWPSRPDPASPPAGGRRPPSWRPPCARYAPRAGPWPTRTWRRASARSPPASATATAGCWPRST